MTRKQFEKLCHGVREDTLADMPDMAICDCAYDLADCLLMDPAVMKFAQKEWPGVEKRVLREIVADHIAG